MKDSVVEDGNNRLCLPGQGTMPIPEVVEILSTAGYDGYLALEWEKRWHPEIEPPEEAFPTYMQYMRSIL